MTNRAWSGAEVSARYAGIELHIEREDEDDRRWWWQYAVRPETGERTMLDVSGTPIIELDHFRCLVDLGLPTRRDFGVMYPPDDSDVFRAWWAVLRLLAVAVALDAS